MREVKVGTAGGPRVGLEPLRWLQGEGRSRAELGEVQRTGSPIREEQAP